MKAPVLFSVENHIAWITLNRPEKRNAINQELLGRLYDALEQTIEDSGIRVAILTGNGKSFCSGLDLTALESENLFDPRGDGRDFLDIVSDCPKPIIGAINGHAITGGFEIALNCDFLIASESASFADTHTRVGIHPGWGMTQLLQQAVGQRMARQLSFTGEFISAATALRLGLVNEVVPPERLLPRAKEIAQAILAADPEVLAAVKELISYRNQSDLAGALARERRCFLMFLQKKLNAAR